MYVKQFDKELYRLFNGTTLACIAEAIPAALGDKWEVKLRKEDKKVDAELYLHGKIVGQIEGERKLPWNKWEFNYAHEGIDFLMKKMRLISKDPERPTFFVLVNEACSRLFITHQANLLESEPFAKPNKYDNGNKEMFFRVPIKGVEGASEFEVAAYERRNPGKQAKHFAAFLNIPDMISKKYRAL